MRQLGALGELLLQHHRVALDRGLGLSRRVQRLVVQRLEVLHRLLGGDQLGGERLGGIGVFGGLGSVAGGGRLVGEGRGLAHVGLRALDILELTVELHLQLALVADHGGGLLRQRLVLALRILDRLLDLDLGISLVVDRGVAPSLRVVPQLHERVGHLFVLFRLRGALRGRPRAGMTKS